MKKICGMGFCGRCNNKTKWHYTILEKDNEFITQVGTLCKSVSAIKLLDGGKYVVEIICEKCGNHYEVNEYCEARVL